MAITDLHIRRAFQILTVILLAGMTLFVVKEGVGEDGEKFFTSIISPDSVEIPSLNVNETVEEQVVQPETEQVQSPERKKIKRPSVKPISKNGIIGDNIENANSTPDGDQLLEDGLYEQALQYYENLSELTPKDPELYLKMGEAFFSLKKFPLAERSYEVAYLLDPSHADTVMRYVKSLLAQRKIVEASNILEKFENQNQEMQFYSAVIYAFLNKPAESKGILNGLVTSKDAEIASKAKIVLNAYQEFDLTTDAQQIYLQTLLAKAFNQLGEYELAIALGLEVIKTKDDYRDIWLIMGHSYLNQSKWEDARASLIKAINLDAKKALTHALLGFANESLQRRRDAIENFKEAIRFGYEPLIQMRQKLAENYFLAGMNEEAIKTYEEVIYHPGAYIDVYFYVRPIFIYIDKLGKGDDALRLAKKAMSEHPGNSMAYNLLGWAYFAAGDDFNAEANLLQALKANPKLAAAYLNLGRLYEKQEKTERAASFYKRAEEFAKEIGDDSIGNLASSLYNKLISVQT